MIKTGKKLNLPLDERFKVSYGTVNIKNPISIYLQMSTWIKPLEDYENYENLIKKLTKDYKQSLNHTLKNSFFDDRKWIVDLDLRSSGMEKDKKSFMSVDTVLFYHEPQNPFRGISKNSLNINVVTYLKYLPKTMKLNVIPRNNYHYINLKF